VDCSTPGQSRECTSSRNEISPNPSGPIHSQRLAAVAQIYLSPAHTEGGVGNRRPGILRSTLDWHEFAVRSAQKWRKSSANRALETPKRARMSFIQLEMSQQIAHPPGVFYPFCSLLGCRVAFSVHAIALGSTPQAVRGREFSGKLKVLNSTLASQCM